MPKFMVQSPEHVARVSLQAVRQRKTIAHTSLLNHALAVLLTVAPTRLVIRGLTASGLIAFMAMGHNDLNR